MKKLHIIHAKSLRETTQSRGKLLPTLEKEVLQWAKKFKKDAHKATVEIQRELQKNPSDKLRNKYFKYLRRLLEIKLEKIEDQAYKSGEDAEPLLKKDLIDFLNIESLRIPEHISCSSISMYEFCPRKWYYRYALGIKFPKTAALHFGSAVDDALNFYFEEKIKGETPPVSAVHAQFFEEFAKGYDEVNWGKTNPKQLEKNGPKIIDKYLESFDRITDAIDVQTEVRIPLDNGGQLLGYIDILEQDAVVDTKTAKKFWNTTGRFAKHLGELQPKAYSLWFLEKYERMPKQFRYQIVTKETDEKGNPDPQTQLISFELKKFELESFRRRIQRIWDDIMEQLPKGKSAFPAQAEVGPEKGKGPGKISPGPLCTQEWCDYASLCKADGLDIPVKWISKTRDMPGHHLYEDGTTSLDREDEWIAAQEENI